MNKELEMEDRAEAQADQDAEQAERSVRYVPRIDKFRFDRWLSIANNSLNKDFTLAEELVLGLDALTEFVQDISPDHLPPNMRNRRLALLRRLWGE